jgi:hypothetical protein
MGAFTGEGPSRRLADPAAAACDEDDMIFQIKIHLLPLNDSPGSNSLLPAGGNRHDIAKSRKSAETTIRCADIALRQ